MFRKAADGCELMLCRTSVMQRMAEENKGLFLTVKDWKEPPSSVGSADSFSPEGGEAKGKNVERLQAAIEKTKLRLVSGGGLC